VIGLGLNACSTSEFAGSGGSNNKKTATTPTTPTTPTNTTNPTTPVVMPTISTNPTYPSVGPNTITFQPDNGAVYHIGNGQFEGSTCISRITGMDLKGTAFIFEFTVQQEVTNVDLQIQDLCGVDYSNLNSATLTRNGQLIRQFYLNPTGLLTAIFGGFRTGNMTLATGTYQFRVESPENPAHPERDRDDFIVGKVVMYSSKPLIKGNTYTQ
jgi:hypothetical protein